MLARVVPPTNDFAALARYLIHGKRRPTHPDRVAWTITQNLGTDDPDLAAAFMQATASLSKRTRNAAYHLMIAWHQREHPTPEIMQEIAIKTLALAGLADHQALIMGHGDTPHRHLHMLINRVHPTTGKAWKHAHDYARFDAIMRQLTEDYGFEHVPAHAFNREATADRPRRPNSRATNAAKRGAPTHRPQWSRNESQKLGTKVSERLDQAAGWDDIEAAFAEEGLRLEVKGQGLVVGTSASYAKFSSLGLTTTAHDLEKRFTAPFRPPRELSPPPPTRHLFTVDAVDIAKALAAWGLADHEGIKAAIEDVTAAREVKRGDAPLLQRLTSDLAKGLWGRTNLTPPRKVKVRRNPQQKKGSEMRER